MSSEYESNSNIAVTIEPKTINEFTKRPEVIDYNVEFIQGQYWVVEGHVVAFILEANEYGIIYQNKIKALDDTAAVFDFEAGQQLVSPKLFKAILQQYNAFMIVPRQQMVESALILYRECFNGGFIVDKKFLPRTQFEAQELLDTENYLNKKRIIPPPIEYRNTKSTHWFKAGVSDEMTVIKLWDPDQDNWVFVNGAVDVSARIGFITKYGGLVSIISSNAGTETFENLSDRIIQTLRTKSIMFIESIVKKQLNEFKPKTKLNNKSSKFIQAKKEFGKNETPVFPIYEIFVKPGMKNKKAYFEIYLVENKVLKYCLVFDEFVNNEFIPATSVLKLKKM